MDRRSDLKQSAHLQRPNTAWGWGNVCLLLPRLLSSSCAPKLCDFRSTRRRGGWASAPGATPRGASRCSTRRPPGLQHRPGTVSGRAPAPLPGNHHHAHTKAGPGGGTQGTGGRRLGQRRSPGMYSSCTSNTTGVDGGTAGLQGTHQQPGVTIHQPAAGARLARPMAARTPTARGGYGVGSREAFCGTGGTHADCTKAQETSSNHTTTTPSCRLHAPAATCLARP
jgi:hypothetical protein